MPPYDSLPPGQTTLSTFHSMQTYLLRKLNMSDIKSEHIVKYTRTYYILKYTKEFAEFMRGTGRFMYLVFAVLLEHWFL